MERAMAPHSSTLAWRIPWVEEPGRLQSMGSLRVGHNWVTSLSLFHLHALEKEMATHSSVIAWRIPGTWEAGRLPSMGSHRVGHDWSNLAAAAADTSYKWNHTKFVFCGWLTSLSMMSSGFIRVVACDKISCLLRLKNIPLHIYATFCLSSHQLIDIWLHPPLGYCK